MHGVWTVAVWSFMAYKSELSLQEKCVLNFHFSCQGKTFPRKWQTSFSANGLSNLVLAVGYALVQTNVIFVLCKNPFQLPTKRTCIRCCECVEQQTTSVKLHFQHQPLCKRIISVAHCR